MCGLHRAWQSARDDAIEARVVAKRIRSIAISSSSGGASPTALNLTSPERVCQAWTITGSGMTAAISGCFAALIGAIVGAIVGGARFAGERATSQPRASA